MEALHVSVNAERYDEVLANSLPEGGDMEIIAKPGAMVSGRAAVMVTFTVALPDGSRQRVQAVTTLVNFQRAAAAFRAELDPRDASLN